MRESKKTLVVGTRGSKLALTQTRWVMGLIRQACPDVNVVEQIIKTHGDHFGSTPLSAMGEKGVFVKELETALESGEIDAAVHSLKDLPSELSPQFKLAAIPEREDPSDCLVSPKWGTLENLPEGAVIGTGSPRRKAQLLALRRDLNIREIRGNVDTRLKKVGSGEYDAIVLAVAGLRRLGLQGNITQIFNPEQMLSAVGQGAVAVEIRSDDKISTDIIGRIDHPETHVCVQAERTLAHELGAGCQTPIGALAVMHDNVIVLKAMLCDPGGETMLRASGSSIPEEPEKAGRTAAQELIKLGAKELLV